MDGKHANGFGDVRALIGVEHFRALRRPYSPTANKGDISAYDHLKKMLGTSAGFDPSSGPERQPARRGSAVLGAQRQAR